MNPPVGANPVSPWRVGALSVRVGRVGARHLQAAVDRFPCMDGAVRGEDAGVEDKFADLERGAGKTHMRRFEPFDRGRDAFF